ncbi:hypothetical protein NDU88_012960 [Pleurodeles waltl]|uniref:Uncharacterized protein n=1 Tax=Pleurodeles waltl TaxID=8319 RepID=A0AAV7R1Q4_PLEWA|nr:hypothetical protein NDU88_012960 [Pleurodeles waltl]
MCNRLTSALVELEISDLGTRNLRGWCCAEGMAATCRLIIEAAVQRLLNPSAVSPSTSPILLCLDVPLPGTLIT